jgi:NAD(P)-dependent dehydrogenase (short-subunit alcohol dehydrogenase family)
MARVLVIGASRGIGREFVRQYVAAGDEVIGTYRRDADAAALSALRATALKLDLLEDGVEQTLAAAMGERPLDLAIINAGVYGPRTTALVTPSRLDFEAVMRTNVYGPMQMIPVLAPRLAAARGTLAVISSKMGSISSMGSSSGWLYRASKAALNAVLKAASNDASTRGVVCLALHPGWVRTDMGGSDADLDITTSVAGMRGVLSAADDSTHGRFLNYDGVELAW